jgi:hypothetical protein
MFLVFKLAIHPPLVGILDPTQGRAGTSWESSHEW